MFPNVSCILHLFLLSIFFPKTSLLFFSLHSICWCLHILFAYSFRVHFVVQLLPPHIYYTCYVLHPPTRSARNSIERIYEKVECNCLVEGSYCTGCVMCNNFVIVVAKAQSEPGLLAQTYCHRWLLALSTRIPSRMHIFYCTAQFFVCDTRYFL